MDAVGALWYAANAVYDLASAFAHSAPAKPKPKPAQARSPPETETSEATSDFPTPDSPSLDLPAPLPTAHVLDPLPALGTDAFHLVLAHLPVRDLLVCERVSTQWRDFVRGDAALWAVRARELKVDMREWAHTLRERGERARERREVREKWRTWEVERGLADEGDESESDTEEEMGADAVSCRHATLAHVAMQRAWTDRHLYECLLPTPAFKLRHVTLDAGEDTLYALTEGSAGDTDELLVLNRYTGALTVTIPWVTRDAAMGSGAGYVMLGSVPAANRHAIGTKRPKARALHVYRTHNAAERSYGLAKRRGARSPPGWKDRGLPLEFFKTVTALDECRAFRVKLDPRAHKQAAVLVGASDTAVVLVYLDEGREEVIEVEALQTILSYTCVEPSERVAHIQDVDLDEHYIYIITQFQCIVVDRNTGDKLVAFPDPYAWYSKQAAVVYAVGYNFPFQLPRRDPRPTTLPPRAPSGLPLSLTAQASVSAYRSDTQTFIFTQSAHNEGYFGDDSGGPDDKLCRIELTDNDLVLRNEHGKVYIVRQYRDVLKAALEEDPTARSAAIGRRTALITMQEHIEDLHVWDNRLYCHAAEMSIICFDMNQMPSFPLVGDDPVPNMTTYVLEISCLEGMQERSSFAVDARGLYLADWDKGYPDSDAEFDLLHEEYVRWGTWPTVIRPNWGCIKAWTVRPESTLLTYEYPLRLARAMQTGLIQILPDDESTDSMTEGYSDDDYDDHHPATVHHHHHQQPQSLPANIVFVSGDYSMALTDLFAGDEAQSAEVESGGEGGETSENDTLAVD